MVTPESKTSPSPAPSPSPAAFVTMSTADSSTSPDAAPAVIANFRLPAFSTIDAAIWFRRAEVQFRLKNVRSPRTQADHVLAALPDALFPLMSQWLDSKGDDPIEYDELKSYLLRKFSLSPEQRVKNILELHQQPLGDQRPSDALTELRALARLPPDLSGSSRSIDMILAIWLHRLPEAIRASITNFTGYDDDASIAEHADRLLDAHLAACRTTVAISANIPPDEADEQDPPDTIALASSSRRRHLRFQKSTTPFKPSSSGSSSTLKPSYSDSSSTSSSSPRRSEFAAKFCFYHARFGHKAKKCEPPCAWPKNVL